MRNIYELDHLSLLSAELNDILPTAELAVYKLPSLPKQYELSLWLIDKDYDSLTLSQQQINQLWQRIPYWIFCWASGLSMAKWIFNNAEKLIGQTVIDFGCGSGVVGIAAKLAGARKVICCDIDEMSLLAARANAELNEVELSYCSDINAFYKKADVLLAADVLYDLENQFLLEVFLKKADRVMIADSRVKNFTHKDYKKITQIHSTTWPDLDEAKEFRNVSLYCST